MVRKGFLFNIILLCAIGVNIIAQDFGFGDDSDWSFSSSNSLSVSIGGEVSASMLAYVKDFSYGLSHVALGDIFSGRLNFSAGTSFADAFINLKLAPTATPISIDEAYVRAYFSSFEVEAGLRKLGWGKADSFGPLDVINPLDYSELTDLSDLLNFKIARPLVHVSWRIGSFSKIEGVFVPWFEPLRYATEGRWVPAQMAQLSQLQSLGVSMNTPDTSALDYAQVGLRFTTTIGSSDFGLQYYYGRLTKPSVTMSFAPPNPTPTAINIAYNPYHQIGVDWAQDLFGFNIRAEFAANITEDLKGDDGVVYNPHLAWSFGFDRNLIWGINLNLQCNETIRLMDDKVNNNPMLDIEAGSDMTSTQIIAALSKTFLRDQIEVRAVIFWEIEAKDFMFMPSLTWTNDDVSIELSGGFFGGDKDGQFGQYQDNSFVKVALRYKF